jgi:hypothetical protein
MGYDAAAGTLRVPFAEAVSECSDRYMPNDCRA